MDQEADNLGERRLVALHDRLVEHSTAINPFTKSGDGIDHRHRLHDDLGRDQVGQHPVDRFHDVELLSWGATEEAKNMTWTTNTGAGLPQRTCVVSKAPAAVLAPYFAGGVEWPRVMA